MTEHLTRHSTEHDDGFTGREEVREPGDLGADAGRPGQDRADFREPGTGEDRGDGQSLSTADLASASTRSVTTDAGPGTTPAASGGDVEAPPLIDEEKVTGFRDRWQNIQTGFVDDPQQSVREADELVAAVISALATTFAEHKGELEGQWQHGEPATEDLRVALRRYRSFFDQLLPR
ncbi:hypothetical protein QRX60_47895 [Amycolatopsis mongoliensis]|uniref:Uncharacterized protein n=1 Tax=Amycolatopsis mongoliensis TaxID=715475 RepID=A0A9Y2JPU5_9PSEU|nr:hypothetical protein [Amycolatopsis sp. 4-36]WIY01660.1 hypothetical protein QRX60_47895 [Amycolatopsis sp. 4-36]